MKDFVRVGVIGLGQRGLWVIRETLLPNEKYRVTAVCDLYADRVEQAQKTVTDMGAPAPFGTTDYREILTREDVDAVLVMCSWETHVSVSVAALRAGKPVGMEVGGAYSVEECWKLVRAQEETGTPFMFLENCCYGRREMMVMNMVDHGLLGDVVHCNGAYEHDLRYEISYGKELRHYRLRNYIHRNCENYPTHELGPIAQILRINRGNRMLYLTSTASCARGLHTYIVEKKADDTELLHTVFRQGDVVTTVIKCAGGETIRLTLGTTLPRFYSRNFTVCGTRGMYEENSDSVFLDCEEHIQCEWNWKKQQCGNADRYAEQYDHPVWKKFLSDGVRGGHGGMDWLVYSEFADCLLEDRPFPIDVYDAAAWMVITPLSEASIARGSAPVDIPDFTNGAWMEE
ncbi:MAG: Gfo/Idh/MocA family oxidoreductase [Clostridia bacterium]|nr:Gfo/Idh/MocA family oxidoreductase [Clostridia bacterium]